MAATAIKHLQQLQLNLIVFELMVYVVVDESNPQHIFIQFNISKYCTLDFILQQMFLFLFNLCLNPTYFSLLLVLFFTQEGK